MEQGSIGWQGLEALLPVISSIGHAEWEAMAEHDPSLREEYRWLGDPYGRYIFRHEVAAADAFFRDLAVTRRFDEDSLTPWGLSAYQRMRDLFERVDFSACRHLIMVGSGPLPVTLIHIHQRTAIPRLTSVDTATEAAGAIERIRTGLGWDRLRAVSGNGLDIDYGDADAVYLANLVTPKAEILRRVADQVAPGTVVIVRDPAGAGELVAERATAGLPSGLRMTHEGEGDGRFLSRNVFLVKEG